MTTDFDTDYGSLAGADLSAHGCTLVRKCLTRPGDALGLDAAGNVTVKSSGNSSGATAKPYGVFASSGSWTAQVGSHWAGGNITRIPVQTTEYAQGLTLTGGRIVPVDKGQMWKVTAAVYFTASQATDVWGRIEGLRAAAGEAHDTGHTYLPKAFNEPYTLPMIITDAGPTPALDNDGFGAVVLRTDMVPAATAVHCRIIVEHLGPRLSPR